MRQMTSQHGTSLLCSTPRLRSGVVQVLRLMKQNLHNEDVQMHGLGVLNTLSLHGQSANPQS